MVMYPCTPGQLHSVQGRNKFNLTAVRVCSGRLFIVRQFSTTKRAELDGTARAGKPLRDDNFAGTGETAEGRFAVSLCPTAQYLRVSTDHQKYSLTHQAETIAAYAENHGMEVVDTFCDAGRSGLSLKHRPALSELLNVVMSGNARFRAVLVYDVSRWGRFQDTDEAAHYEFLCKSAEIPVHYCAEEFTNENLPVNAILKAVKRTMAAEYSREMGVRIFAGCKKIVETGFKSGGLPGYGLDRMMVSASGQPIRILHRSEMKSLRTDRVILVPGPQEEVAWVREIYRLVIENNQTPYRIAKDLNRRGVPCPGRAWDSARILRILTDPKYTGFNVWNRTSFRLGTRRTFHPRSEWILKSGAFAPIVDYEVFQAAQRTLADQRTPYSKEELLERLRVLLRKHGDLSLRLLLAEGGPSYHTFGKHFGSLRRAFRLAGKPDPSVTANREQLAAAAMIREKLIRDLLTLFPAQVALCPANDSCGECLSVDGRVKIAVVVCPQVPRNHRRQWFVDKQWAGHIPFTLFARLSDDSSRIRDLFITATPRRLWIRRLSELQKLSDPLELPDFLQAVERGLPL